MSLLNVRNFVRSRTLIAFDVSYGMLLSTHDRAWLDSIYDSVQGWGAECVSFASRVVPGFDTTSRAGGGTDFGPLSHYVDQVKPTRVIVVTDGIAPRIEPTDPSRWLWVLPAPRPGSRQQGPPSWMPGMRVEYVDLPFVIDELP